MSTGVLMNFLTFTHKAHHQECGASLAEYGLLLFFIVAAAFLSLQRSGSELDSRYASIQQSVLEAGGSTSATQNSDEVSPNVGDDSGDGAASEEDGQAGVGVQPGQSEGGSAFSGPGGDANGGQGDSEDDDPAADGGEASVVPLNTGGNG